MGDAYDNPFERYSYRSELIERLRSTETPVKFGRVSVQSAHRFGFCWGVDRAVAMVRDAIQENPGRQIWLLDQILQGMPIGLGRINPRKNICDPRVKQRRFAKEPIICRQTKVIGVVQPERRFEVVGEGDRNALFGSGRIVGKGRQ